MGGSTRAARRARSARFARNSGRADALHNIRHDPNEYTPVLKKRVSSARPRSAGPLSRNTFAAPMKAETQSAPRKSIAMDMLKFVDSKRPLTASSRRSGDSRNRLLNSSFSSLPASRPGPGPAEYYPDYRNKANYKRTPSASFSREDRMKHLAGETSSETGGRVGPGPKYKPSVVQTKCRHPVTSIGREHR